ncbi:response regulator [Nonomuraea ferruginea]
MSAAPDRLTVLIGDDQPLIREVLTEVLTAEPDLDVVAVAADAREAVRLAVRHLPAVAILDVRMPGGGAWAAREIRSAVARHQGDGVLRLRRLPLRRRDAPRRRPRVPAQRAAQQRHRGGRAAHGRHLLTSLRSAPAPDGRSPTPRRWG